MTTYGCILCVGILAVFALYTLRLRKYQHPLSEGIISLVFCTVCGAIFSKLGYCLLLADTELFGYGIDSLFSFYPYEFSVFCGGIGVLCGIVLASRICKQASVSSLDLFAPCGALLLFVIRIGESQLGSIGAGPLLNGESWLTRIGFAFVNNYGEWHFSVYLLEAILALFCSIYFFFRSFICSRSFYCFKFLFSGFGGFLGIGIDLCLIRIFYCFPIFFWMFRIIMNLH